LAEDVPRQGKKVVDLLLVELVRLGGVLQFGRGLSESSLVRRGEPDSGGASLIALARVAMSSAEAPLIF
jgi:hypothetical protein